MPIKILSAQAQKNEVSVKDGDISGKVPKVEILSVGKAESKGILIISQDKKVYIALPMDSISKILELLTDALSKISGDVPASINVPTQAGPVPVPVAPALKADMQSIIREIKDLKGNLQ
jgi:hypothetical protein